MNKSFNAEVYWSTRKNKVWVVRVGSGYIYVRAKTKQGAETTALENQYGKCKSLSASARLATPYDLGATEN